MVERVLIDTDVLIEYIKGRLELPKLPIYISEITLYEYIRGTDKPSRYKKLLEESFPVIWIDNEILLKAVDIWIQLKNETLIDDRDLIIGATAIVKNIKLYTLNKKHFDRLTKFGLKYYDHKT